jgi:hypothetical protein
MAGLAEDRLHMYMLMCRNQPLDHLDAQLKPPEQQLTATSFLQRLVLMMIVSHLLSWQSAVTGLRCLDTWHEEHPAVQALQGLGELSCSSAQTTPVPREGPPSDHTLPRSAPSVKSCSLVT